MGYLHKNARAVAGAFITAAGPPVGKVYQNLQAVGDNPVGFFALHVTDHPHSAGIMLEAGIIKAPGFQSAGFCFG